jgi:hypothetical protein
MAWRPRTGPRCGATTASGASSASRRPQADLQAGPQGRPGQSMDVCHPQEAHKRQRGREVWKRVKRDPRRLEAKRAVDREYRRRRPSGNGCVDCGRDGVPARTHGGACHRRIRLSRYGDDRRRSLYRLAETHVRFPRKPCAKTTIKAITCTTSHPITSCVPINIGILDVISTMEIEHGDRALGAGSPGPPGAASSPAVVPGRPQPRPRRHRPGPAGGRRRLAAASRSQPDRGLG